MVLAGLFPRSIDNQYAGRKVALWLLGALVLVKAVMGLNCIFNGYTVATTADGIPLSTYTPAGANAVVAFLGVWGYELLLMCLLGVLALARYRAMVPLMFLLLFLEQAGRRAIFSAMPISSTGDAPALSINTVICALTLLGLVLSLWPRKAKVST